MKNFMGGFIGILVVALFILFVIFFMWVAVHGIKLDSGVKDILLQLTGLSGGLAGMVVGFHYNSSRGSAMKDETIKNISESKSQ